MRLVQNILKATPKILTPALQAYTERIESCGPTAKGVFWKNEYWQHRRYKILEKIFDEVAQRGGVTIHDFGCGYGALFDYLSERPVMLDSRYIGTDMCQKMIDAANNRFFDRRATFTRGTMAKEVVDYTIVSGTYNMHINAAPEEWMKYIHGSLKQLWKFTRRGLAFNMLGNATNEKYTGLYYGDPEAFFNFY